MNYKKIILASVIGVILLVSIVLTGQRSQPWGKVYQFTNSEGGFESFTFMYTKERIVKAFADFLFIEEPNAETSYNVIAIDIHKNDANLTFENWLVKEKSMDRLLNTAVDSYSFTINGLPAIAFNESGMGPDGGLPDLGNQLAIYLYHGRYIYDIAQATRVRVPFPLTSENILIRIALSMRFVK